MIQTSPVDHDIATDASGLKGIGGIHKPPATRRSYESAQ